MNTLDGDSAGDGKKQFGCVGHCRVDPRKHSRDCSRADILGKIQSHAYGASCIGAVDQYFGDSHACPPCSIGCSAGVECTFAAEVAEQRREYVRGREDVVEMFGCGGITTVP